MGFWSNLITGEAELGELLEAAGHPDSKPPPPRVASLLITYRCDLSCSYCTFHARPSLTHYEEAGTSQWLSVIDSLADLGVRRVSFSGGEASLRKDLPVLVRRAHDHGCATSLVTNGIALAAKLPELREAGLDALTISLDATDEVTNDSVRQGTGQRHHQLLRTLKLAGSHRDLWVGVNLVLSSRNIREVSSVVALCGDLGVPLQVQPVNAMANTEGLTPDPSVVEAAIEQLLAARQPVGPVSNSEEFLRVIPEFFRTRRMPRPLLCLIPYAEVVITPNLGVQPCCAAPAVGHALDQGLAALWAGPGFAKWRHAATSRSCSNCMLLYHEAPR